MTMIERSLPWIGQTVPSRLASRCDLVDGVAVHARVSTGPVPAGRPPVVLVHGLVVSSRYMEPMAEVLAADTRVYAPDLPGHGRSSKLSGKISVSSLAAALDRWMDTLGLEQAIIVANSFGCQIAAHLACTYPARVRELVLLGPVVEPWARNPIVLAAQGLANVPLEPPSLNGIIAEDLWAMGIPRALALLYAMLTDRIEEKLPAVQARTHILRGEHDPLVSQRWVDRLTSLVPRGTSAVISDAGHALNYNSPDRVAPLVRSLIHESCQVARAS